MSVALILSQVKEILTGHISYSTDGIFSIMYYYLIIIYNHNRNYIYDNFKVNPYFIGLWVFVCLWGHLGNLGT